MGKFIWYWTVGVLTTLFVPSIIMAVLTQLTVSGGDLTDGAPMLFAAITFCGVFLAVGCYAFVPAIAILVIGIIWNKSPSSRLRR